MKQELIVKSNEILDHPIYKTSIELKIFSKIILELRKNPEESMFFLNKKELLESFGCDKDSYGELKKVAERMFRPIDINKGKGNFILRTMFLEINADIEGKIMFEVSPKMKPYFLDLTKNFTQYYFENIVRLKSSFSIRLYELLKQYEKIGNRRIFVIEIRNFLNIDDNKYKLYGDFKRKVVLVAQKELREKTDIFFEFVEIKDGRKIVEINFIIHQNKKPVVLDKVKSKELDETKSTLTEEQETIKNKLVSKYGLSEKTATELVLLVKIEQIEKNILYAEKEHKDGNISKNFSGFLLNAIKNNYANNVSLFDLDNKKKEEQARKEKALAEKKAELKSKFSLEFSKIAKETFLSSLSESEKEELVKKILEEMNLDAIAVGMIKKKGLNTPVAGVGIIKNIPDFEARRDQFIADKLKEAGF